MEVYRTNKSIFVEKGVCWFFLTIGSGFQLKPVGKRLIGEREDILDWDEKDPHNAMDKANIKVLISKSLFRDAGLYEIVYRLDDKNIIGNNADLPLFIGNDDSAQHPHKYDNKTNLMC